MNSQTCKIKIDHLEIMRELVRILRGEASGWSGDRIENAEHQCYLLRRDLPEVSTMLADDLDLNTVDFSEELGISPDRVRWFARRLTIPEQAP